MLARPWSGANGDGRSIVVALGGNALLPPGEEGGIQEILARARASIEPIVTLAAEGWRIAVVHGNGPQIGDELVRNERAVDELPPLPLGVLVAATAGWIGYVIQQALHNALERARIERDVVTLVTQVLVDPNDPELHDASKPIGRVLPEDRARRMEREAGWTIGRYGDGWRRLVPSPHPVSIVESEEVRRLVASGSIVIAAGGGGTPVRQDPVHGLEGVDGVIDKDRAAEILAREIDAEALLILTNIDGAYRAYETADQELLPRLSASEAERLLEAGEFGRGSMGPKVEAAVDFVRNGGQRAHIGALEEGLAVLMGERGTTILPG